MIPLQPYQGIGVKLRLKGGMKEPSWKRVGASPCGQYHLDKENHREIYSKKQSTSRKKQSGTSSNPAHTEVFFEPFLLRFLLSKWYCPQGAPHHPSPPLPLRVPRASTVSILHNKKGHGGRFQG